MAKTAEQKVQAWDKMMEARKTYLKERAVRTKLALAKAAKANITVSDAEVEAEMKRLAKKAG